jgi:5-formyltetrahydrofolate cyclo-ligase
MRGGYRARPLARPACPAAWNDAAVDDDPGAPAEPLAAAKRALRRRLLADRALLTPGQLAAAATALRDAALAEPAITSAATVAAYVSRGSEPGTGPLLVALHALGVRILLPTLREDDDLNWAPYAGPATLRPARRGLLEPIGPPLGLGAVADAAVVLVPGLAAGRDGGRLGRGGGSYDRALARVAEDALTAVLLYPAEVFDAVPTEAHDRPVRAALTAEGLVTLGG